MPSVFQCNVVIFLGYLLFSLYSRAFYCFTVYAVSPSLSPYQRVSAARHAGRDSRACVCADPPPSPPQEFRASAHASAALKTSLAARRLQAGKGKVSMRQAHVDHPSGHGHGGLSRTRESYAKAPPRRRRMRRRLTLT